MTPDINLTLKVKFTNEWQDKRFRERLISGLLAIQHEMREQGNTMEITENKL